jgi:hypothetical protein
MKKNSFRKVKTFLTTFGDKAEKGAIQIQKKSSTAAIGFAISVFLLLLCTFFMCERYRSDRLATQHFCELMKSKCAGVKK